MKLAYPIFREKVERNDAYARPEPDRTGLRQLKHLLRKAAARTVDAVCAAIGRALDAFTPEECANYVKNSGYRT